MGNVLWVSGQGLLDCIYIVVYFRDILLETKDFTFASKVRLIWST